jgi:two-component system response regulator HupR/HoxA
MTDLEEPAAPAVLVVDDENASLELLRVTLGRRHPVFLASSGKQALELLAEHPEIGCAIIDQRMPEMSGTEFISETLEPRPDLIRIILTGYTDIESLIEAVNIGHIFRYLAKPWRKDEIRSVVEQALDVWQLGRDNERLRAELERANAGLRVENAELKREVRQRHGFEEIIGNSPALNKTLDFVERIARTETTALILGPTGSGKGEIARAIHYNGPRAAKPFISENCGAISPELLTSELFGHRRGSFTGATADRKGLFQEADGGTLFLDEIGDCPTELQVRLLRALDEGEIRRVGDDRPIKVDVRIIAATHHDLAADVKAGTFREDLFYRLSVLTVSVPPLSERREDIPLLAEHFLARFAKRRDREVLGFTPETLLRLQQYDFPGNVRELLNEVERGFSLADEGSYVTADLLSAKFGDLIANELPEESVAEGSESLKVLVERYEAQVLRAALERAGGNQSQTARDVGLSRRGLIDKLTRYGLR